MRTSLSFRQVAGSFVGIVVVYLLSVLLGLWWHYGIWQAVAGASVLQAVAAVCCGLFVAVEILSRRDRCGESLRRGDQGVMGLAALFSGVVAATGLLLLLAVRFYYALAEAAAFSFLPAIPDLGVGSSAYWGFGLLGCTASLFWVFAQDRRLATCLYALVVAVAMWFSLSWPIQHSGARGGLGAGGASYLLLGSTAALMGLIAILTRLSRSPSRSRRAESPGDRAGALPGLHIPCGIQAVLLVLLVCYHVVVPIPPPWFGNRVAAMVNSVAALLGVLGCATFGSGRWHRLFIDAGLSFVVLAFGSAAITVVPQQSNPMVQRYPETMNALMVGFTVAMGVLTWAFLMGRSRRARGDSSSFAAARVVDLQRFAFFSGALALVAAGLMALWPRMRFVAVADDSIGRILAGFGAHLFMLLVMLICARLIKRLPFHLLAAMSFVSTIGFMMLRMYPYTPGFG